MSMRASKIYMADHESFMASEPRAREAPPALSTNIARQQNIGPELVPLQASPPAFLGLSSIRKEGFNAPLKPGRSRRSASNRSRKRISWPDNPAGQPWRGRTQRRVSNTQFLGRTWKLLNHFPTQRGCFPSYLAPSPG
jgi:hypothetical protein